MQIELEIKEILDSGGDAEEKAKNISKFMTWGKDNIKNAILKYGTSGKEGRSAVIEEFWAECSEKNNKGRV